MISQADSTATRACSASGSGAPKTAWPVAEELDDGPAAALDHPETLSV
jgi:hypothetical protein